MALFVAAALWISAVGSAQAESQLHGTINAVIGVPYQWGGETEQGFDCSGFTLYVFAKFGIELPHYSGAQAGMGDKVSKDELIPGDLVFFNTDGYSISHVGIYVGNGEFAHAEWKRGIMISKLSESYYANRYVTARRILSDEQQAHLTAQ